MNVRLILNIIGKLLSLEAGLMTPALLVSLIYREGDAPSLLYSMGILLLVGLPLMLFIRPESPDVRSREGFVAGGLAWVVLSLFGALPFMFSGVTVFYWDALFETVSGYTTTGASILTQIEGLPHGILFWRSSMHWVGGMGVLILTLAVLPKVSGHGSLLAKAESPGITFSKMLPKITSTARLMYAVYAGLTILLIILLVMSGLNLYDALIHAMGTAGTGGFSNRNQSVGAYNNIWTEVVIMVFMLLFGTNFAVYFHLLRGDKLKSFKNEEVRTYYLLAFVSILLICVNTIPHYGDFWTALRYSAFQVSSIMSTTGFVTTNFDHWPEFSRILMLLLMLIGACAGSTAGGIKVARIVLLRKAAAREVGQAFQPRKVRLVTLDRRTVGDDILRSVVLFLVIYMFFLFFGTLAASTDGHDFITCFSAVASCLSNIGPGLSLVGPEGNFSIFSPHVKFLLSFFMLAGRLEFIPLLVLFHPAIWKKAGRHSPEPGVKMKNKMEVSYES